MEKVLESHDGHISHGRVVMYDPLQVVLDALAASGKKVRQRGRHWVAQCPAHDDETPSLSISKGGVGCLVYCHAGCSVDSICDSLGLKQTDLFHKTQDETQTDYHASLDEAIEVHRYGMPVEGVWEYPQFVVVRLRKQDGRKTFRQFRWTRHGWTCGLGQSPEDGWELYGYEPDREGAVVITEGEKTADAARSVGLHAVTSGMGSNAVSRFNWSCLAGRTCVILPDNDRPGRKYARDVTVALQALSPQPSIRTIALPGLPEGGDFADWIGPDGEMRDRTPEEIKARLQLLAKQVPSERRTGRMSAQELIQTYPSMREPVIHGLLRRGEIMNIIAPPKAGKSWMVMDICLALSCGRSWMDHFMVERGRCILLDNELHGETLADRLPRVAAARGLELEDYGQMLYVDVLRGRGVDLPGLMQYFEDDEPGDWSVIVLDALYRFWPSDCDENDNGSVTQQFNVLDMLASRLNCSIIIIHHTSKGSQSEKSIVDVGAGAGAQARATDSHLILRRHMDRDCVVLDAAVRSWRPVEPLGLYLDKQTYGVPVFDIDRTLDVEALEGSAKARAVEKERKSHREDGVTYDPAME